MYAKALTALYEFETISNNPISTYHFTYVDNPLEYEYSSRDRRDLLSTVKLASVGQARDHSILF